MVYVNRTYVRIPWRRGRPRPVDKCPCTSCVYQLQTPVPAAATPAAYTNCTKFDKNFYENLVFCELIFLKFYDIIFIEK
jgi:hypothetical protein